MPAWYGKSHQTATRRSIWCSHSHHFRIAVALIVTIHCAICLLLHFSNPRYSLDRFYRFFMATSDSTGRRLTCAIDIFLWRYPLVLIVNLSSVHQLLCNQSASCQCICSWLHEKLDGCYPRCVSRTHLEHIIGIALRINRSSNSPAQYKLNPAHPISLRLRTFFVPKRYLQG